MKTILFLNPVATYCIRSLYFLSGIFLGFSCFGMEKDLRDPAAFPGKPPFTVEQIKLFNSGKLIHGQFFFTDADGTRYFLKPYSVSELVYGHIAHELNIPCQYSWPFAIKESDFKKEQQELIPKWVKKQDRLLVIRYEPETIQSSYVLGSFIVEYQLWVKKIEQSVNLIIPNFNFSDLTKNEHVESLQDLDALEARHRKIVIEEIERVRGDFFILHENVCNRKLAVYPSIYNKKGGLVQRTTLDPSGRCSNFGIKQWLSDIPVHKKNYLDNAKQPIQFDDDSLVRIAVLNAIFNMGDRRFDNLLYRPKTKKFIAIDNENWYSGHSYRWSVCEDREWFSPEEIRLFLLYRNFLHRFLERYPTPDSLVPIIKQYCTADPRVNHYSTIQKDAFIEEESQNSTIQKDAFIKEESQSLYFNAYRLKQEIDKDINNSPALRIGCNANFGNKDLID